MTAKSALQLRHDALRLLEAAYVVRRRSARPHGLRTEILVRMLKRMAIRLTEQASEYEKVTSASDISS
jgi:hypothetical protein